MQEVRVSNGRRVNTTQGVVSCEAFVSDDVYRLELARVFEKGWIFLDHESEIPAPGDYVVRTLGKAPVIVIREGLIAESAGDLTAKSMCSNMVEMKCGSPAGESGLSLRRPPR